TGGPGAGRTANGRIASRRRPPWSEQCTWRGSDGCARCGGIPVDSGRRSRYQGPVGPERSLGSAPDWGSGGREFESLRPDHSGPARRAVADPSNVERLATERMPEFGGGGAVGLFGAKCARCGKRRTQREYEGLPTCESCEKLIEAKVRAAKEQTRRCPLDGAEMAKEVVLNLIIDRCPSCRGVWLDGGELEDMRKAIEAGLAQEFVRGMVFPLG